MPHELLRRKRPLEGYAFVAGLMLVAGWGFVLLNLEARRTAEIERIRLNSAQISNSLSYGVARVSSELDTLLLFMRAMRVVREDSVTWQEIVTKDFTLNRQTEQIAIMAKDGMMVTSSKMLYPKKPIDLSDRAHFKVHVHSGRDVLDISAPVLGRASKKWSIQYTRPLFDKSKAFSGVIVVSLSIDKLVKLFDGVTIGKNDGIAIVGNDGVVRAGAGLFADLIGDRMPITLASVQATIGANNIAAVEKVENYPLRVIVAIAAPSMATWYWNNTFYLLALGTGTLVILVGGLHLFRQRQKHFWLLEERRRLQLDREIVQRTSQLKSDFLSVMSHEIRTPLNGILGSLELVSTDKLSASTCKQIEIARSSGSYLLGLIDDILVFMKSEGGDIELDEQFHSIRNLFGDASNSLVHSVRESKNDLDVEVGDDVPEKLKFDAVKLRQVITNLLSNANKFTENGTLTLEASLIDRDAESARIRVSVKDTGIGIPKDKQAAIFERFTSLDSSLSRRSDGTGLGLTICKKIIYSMGSDIMVESEFGKGSCFSFEVALPVAAASDSESSTQGNLVEEQRCRGLKVLLAEDNETNAYIATEFLATVDHSVDRARDGNEAVAAAQNEAYDVILMDLSMPKCDGISAARAIRSGNNPNVSTPIVALTAHVSSDTATWIENAGINAYVTKPISRDQLLDAVQRHHVATPTENDSIVGIAQSNVEVVIASDDLPVMDYDQFNDFFGNYSAEKRVKLLSALLDDLKRNKSKVSNAVKELDEANARAGAHALFGSSGAIGAERLSKFSRQVEYSQDTGPSFDWDACKKLVNLIDLTVLEVNGTLESLCVEDNVSEAMAI